MRMYLSPPFAVKLTQDGSNKITFFVKDAANEISFLSEIYKNQCLDYASRYYPIRLIINTAHSSYLLHVIRYNT